MSVVTLIVGMWIGSLLISCNQALSQCKPTSIESTIWGGNELVEIHGPKPMRYLNGVVRVGDQPLADVLVEVYDHPNIAVALPTENRKEQHRIAACITSEDGKFFLKVPPGYYELRLSKSKEWDVTSVKITIKKSGHRKGIVVPLVLGT